MKLDKSLDRLGVGLICVLGLLLAAAWLSGMPVGRPTEPTAGPIFMGMFLVALGSMFLASYYYSAKSFFLRWLLSFASGWPGAHTPKMAFFFSLLCVVAGVGAIADGLGWQLTG